MNRLETDLLVCHALRISRSQWLAGLAPPADDESRARVDALLARRAAGEPIAYITGEREFWSLALKVTPDVLIPRPETELLVEQVLARVPPDSDAWIADIGTGSGAVALAIARERPRASVIATDISGKALAVARENAARHRLANVGFRQGVACDPLRPDRFAMVVSNPPYIAVNDPHLGQGDLRFEPRSALVAGDDGLDVLRDVIACAPDVLVAGGTLMVEHGCDQGDAVHALFVREGFGEVTLHRDLAGLPRVTSGVWHG